jgi:hypothetical protein
MSFRRSSKFNPPRDRNSRLSVVKRIPYHPSAEPRSSRLSLSTFASSLQNPLIQKIISDQQKVSELKVQMDSRIHMILKRTEIHKIGYSEELYELTCQQHIELNKRLMMLLIEYQRDLGEFDSLLESSSNLDTIVQYASDLEKIIEKYEKMIAELVSAKIKLDDEEMEGTVKRLLEDVETERLLRGKPNPEQRPSYSVMSWDPHHPRTSRLSALRKF